MAMLRRMAKRLIPGFMGVLRSHPCAAIERVWPRELGGGGGGSAAGGGGTLRCACGERAAPSASSIGARGAACADVAAAAVFWYRVVADGDVG
jgi:hypothetical protein